jgi:hypothetical protein
MLCAMTYGSPTEFSETTRPGGRPAGPASDAPAAKTPAMQQWMPLIALAVALVAVALALIGWFRPSTGPGKFSDEQRAEAKTQVCAATTNVREGVSINTYRRNTQGDAAGALAVAANARLALYGGGAYLQNQLDEHPATPSDLADAVSAMADTIQNLGINYLADAPDTAQQPLRDSLTTELQQLNELCK